MKLKKELYQKLIRIRKNKDIDSVWDVEMKGIKDTSGFDSLECHIVLYPYSRQINSLNFQFHPFEEYAKDINLKQQSAYSKIVTNFNKFFGLILGLAITLVFVLIKPEDLFSVESVVSVFAAYAIGKEMWFDLEKYIINFFNKSALRKIIRYQKDYFKCKLERDTTLTKYINLAKINRYQRTTILPQKMNLIQNNNSKTIRMLFDLKCIEELKDSSSHLLSIHINKNKLTTFESRGFLLGIKLSFNKKTLGTTSSYELFQSLNNYESGCVAENGQWIKDSVFLRKTLSVHRLKFYLSTKLLNDEHII